MANSSVTVRTQQITRDLLAQFAGNHRVVRLLENLVTDVTSTLPDGIDALEQQQQTISALANMAGALALQALQLAESMERPAVALVDALPDHVPVLAQVDAPQEHAPVVVVPALDADVQPPAQPASGAYFIYGGTAGAVLWQSATDSTDFTAVGTSGQALVSGGTGTPTWTTGKLTLDADFKSTGGSVILRATAPTDITLPSTGTLATLAGSESLTNKTLQDSTTFFADNTDATKKMQFELSAISTGTTRTLSVPDVNTTIVGDNATQTLTNKTINGSNNTLSNIGNSSLSNSTVTVNGTSIALGGSGTVAAAAGTLTGTALASNVLSASLNAVTPTGGTFAITGKLSATDVSMPTTDGVTGFAVNGTIKTMATTAGGLPTASTVGAGARAVCTNSSVTTFGSNLVGGGASCVPVYSDGTNWVVG